MAEIKVEKSPAIQKGRPGSVHLLLIGDDGETKATVMVYPKFEKPPFTDTFIVRINKGSPLFPDVDVRLTL